MKQITFNAFPKVQTSPSFTLPREYSLINATSSSIVPSQSLVSWITTESPTCVSMVTAEVARGHCAVLTTSWWINKQMHRSADRCETRRMISYFYCCDEVPCVRNAAAGFDKRSKHLQCKQLVHSWPWVVRLMRDTRLGSAEVLFFLSTHIQQLIHRNSYAATYHVDSIRNC